MARGQHSHAAAGKETKVLAERLDQVVGTGGNALPRHPAGIPTDCLDRDGRVETPTGASPLHLDSLRSEEHTSELQSPCNLVCRLLLEKKKKNIGSRPHEPSKHLDSA